jgi:hypothetical protein
MSNRVTSALLAVVVAGCVVLGVFQIFSKSPGSNTTEPATPFTPAATAPAGNRPQTIASPTLVYHTAPPVPKTPAPAPPKSAAHVEPAAADSVLRINGYEVLDPMARLALGMVGSDPDAEDYWVSAINDSSLPAEERKDLIEDLNEDGLSDPHHPTPQDLPIIVSRLRLIERLAPNAMDDVNRDAFAEAYQDLTGLLNGQEPK